MIREQLIMTAGLEIQDALLVLGFLKSFVRERSTDCLCLRTYHELLGLPGAFRRENVLGTLLIKHTDNAVRRGVGSVCSNFIRDIEIP